MNVREIMKTNVVTVFEDDAFKDIVEALIEHDISGVPVVDIRHRVLGVVTESDLLAKEAYPRRDDRKVARLAALLTGEPDHVRKAAALTAKELMTSPPLTVTPAATVHYAARVMFERGIKRLPVVDNDHLVGIVSRHDVLEVFVRADEELREEVQHLLKRCLFLPPEHEISVSVDRGVVTLRGTVQFESDAHIAAALVAPIDGVVGVDDRLAYREDDPPRRDVRAARLNALIH